MAEARDRPRSTGAVASATAELRHAKRHGLFARRVSLNVCNSAVPNGDRTSSYRPSPVIEVYPSAALSIIQSALIRPICAALASVNRRRALISRCSQRGRLRRRYREHLGERRVWLDADRNGDHRAGEVNGPIGALSLGGLAPRRIGAPIGPRRQYMARSGFGR